MDYDVLLCQFFLLGTLLLCCCCFYWFIWLVLVLLICNCASYVICVVHEVWCVVQWWIWVCYIDGGAGNSGYENLSIQFLLRLYLHQGFAHTIEVVELFCWFLEWYVLSEMAVFGPWLILSSQLMRRWNVVYQIRAFTAILSQCG